MYAGGVRCKNTEEHMVTHTSRTISKSTKVFSMRRVNRLIDFRLHERNSDLIKWCQGSISWG